jgi:hypothetical protein
LESNPVPQLFAEGEEGESPAQGFFERDPDGGNRPARPTQMFTVDLEEKRLGLLRDVVPTATTFGVLVNPSYPAAEVQLRDVQNAAIRLGMKLLVVRAIRTLTSTPHSQRSSSSGLQRYRSTALKEVVADLGGPLKNF